MANQSLTKVQHIDPEFAEAYAEAERAAKVPRSTEPRPVASNSQSAKSQVDDIEEGVIALKEIAERTTANSRKRSECTPGFDEVENDLSNVLKTGWDFLTRPL